MVNTKKYQYPHLAEWNDVGEAEVPQNRTVAFLVESGVVSPLVVVVIGYRDDQFRPPHPLTGETRYLDYNDNTIEGRVLAWSEIRWRDP